MRQEPSRPISYSDFLKSIAFGKREFNTEEDLMNCLEDYVKVVYECDLNYPSTIPPSETRRYIYRAYDGEIILYFEKFFDAIRCADEGLRIEFISVAKDSREYRIAHTNSTRRDIECCLHFDNLKFKIGGELRDIQYFAEPRESLS